MLLSTHMYLPSPAPTRVKVTPSVSKDLRVMTEMRDFQPSIIRHLIQKKGMFSVLVRIGIADHPVRIDRILVGMSIFGQVFYSNDTNIFSPVMV